MNKRSFLKGLFGAVVAATIPLPVIKAVKENPWVRRVWPGLIASELIDVHPMPGPTGHVFYLNYMGGDGKVVETGNPPKKVYLNDEQSV